ncbi:RdgB/HAM1 family non-canonical purine NTP pyrophosphatase [Govanella unica]|uniref:dITP/XTP pyrophosphatase n=1 Tax=Govanella unica TaxID=2975056 RepID=A0A9X3TZH4_9PROT|nr:RdgB/HAM1 family non-canonical purine NTP pyrophosphatase [Govania unica]MDA5194653.1 RdgB/HAM1 family non-canonical purine NTP pyrophosphatase [Govania unica]
MYRRFDGDKLIVASHNAGKVREINDLLRPFRIDAVSAGDLGLPEPEETGLTFRANAELKALAAAEAANLPALADDSGLAVDALCGDPGIYSARWAETPNGRDFTYAMGRVEEALQDHSNRHARFVCALSLAWPDGHVETFEGTVEGELVFPARGTEGFGYDPIFQAEGHAVTFGEMDPEEKHRISHRADAFRQLINACFNYR